jgi:hypothetical protein
VRRPDLIGCGRHTGWSNSTLASEGAGQRGGRLLGVGEAVLVNLGESWFEVAVLELVVGLGWWSLSEGGLWGFRRVGGR